MKDIAIKVEHISKKYQIGENKIHPTLRDKLIELPNRLFKGPKKTKEFWALKDVSFEVKKGEVVGIIGRNGAGKSTLLKILARITEPTSGQVTMYGRVASMLEVGTGFNPELTGRENIFLNGAIIGMKKSEIKAKFNEIVEFSGVGKFLDTPVKHYSSGMYVRLAFAVAAHLDADILLVDEVLAVGDAEFQKKCLGKMSDLAKSGKTVIYVSHSLSTIKTLCKKCIYLQNSSLKSFGNTEKIISEYRFNFSNIGKNENTLVTKEHLSTPYVTIKSISVSGDKSRKITVNSNINIDISYVITQKVNNFGFTVILKESETDQVVFSSISNSERNWYLRTMEKGKYNTKCIIPKFLLNDKAYIIDINIFCYKYTQVAHYYNVIQLKVFDHNINRYDYKNAYEGITRPLLKWNTEKINL